MGKVTLYSTHCPQCRALENQLKQKNIEFIVKDDINEMLELGFTSAPILEVNGNYMRFKDALNWVKEC